MHLIIKIVFNSIIDGFEAMRIKEVAFKILNFSTNYVIIKLRWSDHFINWKELILRFLGLPIVVKFS